MFNIEWLNLNSFNQTHAESIIYKVICYTYHVVFIFMKEITFYEYCKSHKRRINKSSF